MSYRQFFKVQADAQAFADQIHAQLIATNPAYAASVASGQTVRWYNARTDLANAVPSGTFSVTVKDRALPVLTPAQIATLVPDSPTSPAASNLSISVQGA